MVVSTQTKTPRLMMLRERSASLPQSGRKWSVQAAGAAAAAVAEAEGAADGATPRWQRGQAAAVLAGRTSAVGQPQKTWRRSSMSEVDMRINAARRAGAWTLLGGLLGVGAAAERERERQLGELRQRPRGESEAEAHAEEECTEELYHRTMTDAAFKRRLSGLAVLFVYGAWAILVWCSQKIQARPRPELPPLLRRASRRAAGAVACPAQSRSPIDDVDRPCPNTQVHACVREPCIPAAGRQGRERLCARLVSSRKL